MIQESISDLLTKEQNDSLKLLFRLYKQIELSQLQTAYQSGRVDMISKTQKTGQDFINENYETNE